MVSRWQLWARFYLKNPNGLYNLWEYSNINITTCDQYLACAWYWYAFKRKQTGMNLLGFLISHPRNRFLSWIIHSKNIVCERRMCYLRFISLQTPKQLSTPCRFIFISWRYLGVIMLKLKFLCTKLRNGVWSSELFSYEHLLKYKLN